MEGIKSFGLSNKIYYCEVSALKINKNKVTMDPPLHN